MSFRQTLVRLAEHARTPLIRFPDRKAPHKAHEATAHPCAPQSVIDNFARFQGQQANPAASAAQASSSYGGPAAHSQGGAGAGGKAVGAESELPERLRRSYWSALSEEELDAVMSGGASATAPVTREYKLKWYTPQI
ncbi:hypothetical protein Rhopal_002617-T1 [Rhodotorula paludigena]|uniref:Uncharacterized protein n=1 Tax=Rhodotorula paludigena TaxID=86838 RepID=A0AAV5GAP9_9BASI|nr:hypothetical protein Rhopal_002617-T1 [Rhodotorula paludigena]